jgi:hypothetical protein
VGSDALGERAEQGKSVHPQCDQLVGVHRVRPDEPP